MNSEQANTGPLAALQCAVEAVARSKNLLTSASVETLGHCERELEAAIRSLERAKRDLETGHSEAGVFQSSARRLQREVSAFGRLLRQAEEFHQGWIALSESSLGGYTASGDAARVDRSCSRIALKG